ncbi:hypothetical protein [Flagellimonas sp.]|uniref:hypothetical protein n=1 Tax=Flagellimonas sp. TaxID=2058762 RepID=UPI003F4A63D0
MNATEQIPDLLIYKKDTVFIYSNPLKGKEHLLKKDSVFSEYGCINTGCWRGYQATWEFIDDKLFLIRISSCCSSKITANLEMVFDEEYTNQKVQAKWFSGKIIIPNGKKLYAEHMGYSTVHEYEDILEFNNGVKTKITRVDNTKTSISYLYGDKLIIELIKNLDKRILDEVWKKKFNLSFYVDVEADEDRQVTNVKVEQVKEIKYKREIIEVIMGIDDWDILYRHGKRADLPWLYPVIIDRKKLKEYKKYW